MSSMAREMFGLRSGGGRRPRSSNSEAGSGGGASRRPEGVSRELFMLTGGVTPASLMPAPSLGLQSKPVARRRWARTPFHRSPQDTSLTLEHWTPVGQPHDSYAFARFNRPVRMVTYNEAEYEAVIANLHPLNVDETALAALKIGDSSPTQKQNINTQRSTTRKKAEVKKVDDDVSMVVAEEAARAASPVTSPGVVTAEGSGAIVTRAGGTPKTLKDIMSPIIKAPSAAPASSVAAGTRKSIIASPKALALAAEMANIRLPDEAVKPPKSPRAPKATRTPRTPKPPPTPRPTAAAVVESESVPSATSGAEAAASAEANTAVENLRQSLHYVKAQKAWSREETDELFELCARFDLRFTVVHDRWPDTFEARSVEELKDRYYSIAKKLVEYRTRSNKDALSTLPAALKQHCQAISMNPYDYEYECIRKNQLEWQYRRSKQELREEEETVREARRIEANRKRLAKERQRLAKLLTPHGDIKLGRKGVDGAKALAAAAVVGMPQKTFPHRKLQSGAYARSSMIYTPVSQSQRISKRIDAALKDLGVGTRPTPTSIVVDNFDLLRMDILAYIELQRTVMRKEEDVHALRVKLAKMKGEPSPAAPPGVTLSHKKRKIDDVELGSLFGGPLLKKCNTGTQATQGS